MRVVARATIAALLLCFSVPGLGAGAEMQAAGKQHINIPAQKLEQALQMLARERGLQMVYRSEVIGELSTRGVSGELTAEEALTRLLVGTGLTYRYLDERMITITPATPTARSGNKTANAAGAIHLVQAVNSAAFAEVPPATVEEDEKKPADASHKKAAAEDSEATVVEVTGSRIRSLLGEATFTPMTTFTRKDIERAGISTVGELGRMIPQVYSQGSYDGIGFGGQSTGLSGTADGSRASSTNTTRTTFNLRGLGTENTLVLVNGRRVAKTGVIRGDDANDLAGIPISSIERVEVLTDGASAIYGSDAVGGVINIIQRKDYSGTEASLTYENTFDTDTAVTTATLSRNFSVGKLYTALSGTYQTRNAFAAVDRYFTATDDWRTLGGTSAPRGIARGGAGLVLGPGIVRATSGNLPGRTSPYALIPMGADGSLRPASDYVSITSADLPAYTGEWAKYVNMISPQTNRAVSMRMNYPVTERVELFLDSRYSETFTAIEGQPVSFRNSMVVPAAYPANPFGVNIQLSKTFWELGQRQGQKDAKTDNTSIATGITGLFGDDWRYEASFDWNRGVLQDSNAYDPVLQSDVFNDAIDGASPPVLLYDSLSVAPNDTDLLLSFLRPGNRLDRDVNMGLSVAVDGPVWEMPAGALRVAVGVERRRETAKTFQSIPENPLINLSLLGNFERDIDSAYVEVLVPLVSQEQGIPLVNRLDFTSAVRYDKYSDAGSDHSPRYGIQYRPVSWLMLRGTRNHAFRAPNLQSLYRPVTTSSQRFSIFDMFGIPTPIDHERNDERLNYDVNTLIGGNLALKPEKSVSNNFGVVLEIPVGPLTGLSISADMVDFEYTDRIGRLDTQFILDFLPERVERGDGLPGDPPGLPGRITRIDNRAFNIAEVDIRSFDYQVRYTRATSLGNFDFRAAATVYDSYESRSAPTAASNSTAYQYPTRYTWQSYWNRGALGLGVTGFYQDEQYTNVSRTTVRFDNAIEWNLQMAYDLGAAGFNGGGNWMNSLLADMKLSLTIFNILDTEPPHVQGNAGFAVTDPRMRRYSLSVRKSF